MKNFTVILLFTLFSHGAIAQLSISGGYDHRSEDTMISLKKHFTAPSKASLYRYNIGYLKVGYRTKKRLILTSEIGFSTFKERNFSQAEYKIVGGWAYQYHTSKYYKSNYSYSTMNINFGVNRLFEWKGLLLKKVAHSIFIGAFVQTDLLINYRNDNKTIQTVEGNNNNINHTYVVTKNETESSIITPLEAKKVRLNVGIGITKRTQFHSFFIEYKAEFSVGLYKRFTQNDINKYNETRLEYDSRIYYPIIETGIGIGYVFNTKKVKTVSSIGQ